MLAPLVGGPGFATQLRFEKNDCLADPMNNFFLNAIASRNRVHRQGGGPLCLHLMELNSNSPALASLQESKAQYWPNP